MKWFFGGKKWVQFLKIFWGDFMDFFFSLEERNKKKKKKNPGKKEQEIIQWFHTKYMKEKEKKHFGRNFVFSASQVINTGEKTI